MTTQVIDSSNIANEPYYNLCRISDALLCWNPIGAMQATPGLRVEVTKDDCGNVVTVAKL